MYAIRVDTTRRVLEMELSGRLSTAEAMRAVTQAAALAEAGGLRALKCDLGTLERGPARLLKVAAVVALRLQPGMRVALVAGAGQGAAVERFIGFTGQGKNVQLFDSTGDAETWLAQLAQKPTARLSSTELRHANEILKAPRRAKRTTSSSPIDGTSGRQPAA